MAQLTADRDTPLKAGDFLVLPVAPDTIIFAGALVVVDPLNGTALPGMEAPELKAAGRAEEYVNNLGGEPAAKTVKVRRGVFKFDNSETDPVLPHNILSECYIVDDQTVAGTNDQGNRSVAGKVLGVEPDGVWVEIR